MAQGKWGAACLCVPWPTNASRRPSGGLAGTMAAPGRRGPVGPSPEVPTAWRQGAPCNETGHMVAGPTAPSPGGQDGHDEFAPPPLHTHTHTHTLTLTHPNQLEARGMGRVQKEVSKEGQEGVREKSLQCGARWGENGKGQGALRVQGVVARGEGPEGATRYRVNSWWGGLLGTGKSLIK